MTISSTTVKNSYSGNGTLDTFNYTFKVFADADIQVIIRDASATETVKTLTTHYTVTGAGSASGGTIVFTAGNIPSATETVVIRRASPQTQAIDYIANDPFPAESHEEGLDRSMMAIQQLQEEVDRSIKLSRTNTMTSTEFTIGDTDRANKVFGFDSAGELVVTQELGTFRGDWSASTAYEVRDLVKDTSTNNIFICLTEHTSSGVEPLTTNTDSAKWSLIVDAASATSSASAAAASATAASTSETNAATSETNAATSASSAASSLSDTQTIFDNFDDRFLGTKASDPTLDNDGNALLEGAMYYNSTDNDIRFYNGTSWDAPATDAATSATNAATSETNAASSASSASSSASTATTKASEASTSATNAATSESNASTSETNAASSASAASTSATNAATSASSASTSATNASNSATAAQTAQAAAEAALDNFDDIYLGAKASDPSLDNDGDALNDGDLYFNTTNDVLRVYNNSTWQDAALDASSFISTSGGSINGNFSVDGGTIKLDGNYPVGTDNVALGNTALDSVEAGGNYNVAVGANTLTANTTGDSNTAVGFNALDANTTANQNTAVGSSSLTSNTTSNANSAFGYFAMLCNTGGCNTALGRCSLRNNTTASNNTAVGTNAMTLNTTGCQNTAVGSPVLQSNTTGNFNTAVGFGSLTANTTGGYNTAIGNVTLCSNTTGGNNVAVGYNSLFSNTTGKQNTALGLQSLRNNTTASCNTAVGLSALCGNTTGVNNSALGHSALRFNTTANANTAVGYFSLYTNTTASNNTAVGLCSLYANTTGANNTAVGVCSLFANTTGCQNTALGDSSLKCNTTGNCNTSLGLNSLLVNTTGSTNTAIGRNAGVTTTTGSNLTMLGYDARSSSPTATNEITLGNANVTVLRMGNGVKIIDGGALVGGAVDLTAVSTNIIPDTNDSLDLGSSSFVWRNIYTGDLHLSNEAKEEGNSVDGTKGNWTIQEGSEDLFIVNNKSGKKYKFKLEEI